MSLRDIILGSAITVVTGGLIYFCVNAGDLRSEKIVDRVNIGNTTVQVVKEDRKFFGDQLRLDILDQEGKLRVSTYSNKFRNEGIRFYEDNKPQRTTKIGTYE